MKRCLLFVEALVLAGTAGWAQPRIISFAPNGELIWSNYMYRGFYNVESAPAPAGPWSVFATVADLQWAQTNLVSLQVPATNAQAFYRVACLRPNPIGVWDYSGYDHQGHLVLTGYLSIASMSLLSINPPVVYAVQGSWDLQYAGPPTNQLWWLGPQIGTGSLTGTMEVDTAAMPLVWPTNFIDYNIELLNTALGPNTYTGMWLYSTSVGPYGGPFSARRRSSPSFQTNSTHHQLLRQF